MAHTFILFDYTGQFETGVHPEGVGGLLGCSPSPKLKFKKTQIL